MEIILTVLAVFTVIIGSELWWRRRTIHDEFSRKFIHITVGSFVAFWPFFLSWHQIELLSVAFLAVISISKYLGLFQAIHSVQRPTWGEVFFAAAVGLAALITHDKWIYATALLTMGLADGIAAVVGTHYGGRQRYSVFGYAKSIVGTLVFFVISAAILLGYNHFGGHPMGPAVLLGISMLVTALENVAVGGLDNLLVPLAVTLILTNR
jgi:phytol kinase